MADITSIPVAPKRLATGLFSAAQSVADVWSRAFEARRLAETYLFQDDDLLAAQGISRDAVIDRIRLILTGAA